MKPAYYNEIDPFAAAWLRELIAAGEIAAGDVDTRSITDVRADDLVPYGQCHFFAGIGGWSLALRLAGIPDDVPVWTGSCPCQPFSVAGKGRGTADERHLWPELRRLIAERRPPACLGEQVAGRAGLDWLASVRADLEGLAYAVGAADLCAAGVGAPHIRQRIYWGGVADAGRLRIRGEGPRPAAGAPGGVQGEDGQRERVRADARAGAAVAGGVGDTSGEGLPQPQPSPLVGARRREEGRATREPGPALDGPWNAAGRVAGRVPQVVGAGKAGGLVNANGDRWQQGRCNDSRHSTPQGGGTATVSCDGGSSFWSDGGRIECSDGRSRPTAPIARRVDDGVPARVVLLRGYGNAIVPQVGAAYARSFLEAAGVMA